jgi:Leucine-rich repeat (LRR) protein
MAETIIKPVKRLSEYATDHPIHGRNDSYKTEQYCDPTYYDKKNKSLDLGFQSLKNITQHENHFSSLKILYLASNALHDLPNELPNLEILHVPDNELTKIPFYDKLKELYIMNNKILDLQNYNESNLKILDCSGNDGMSIDIYLPKLTYLFANNIGLRNLKGNFPRIKILAVGDNKLESIYPIDTLVELSVDKNRLTSIPSMSNLVRLFADNNKITKLGTFPNLKIANLQFNKLEECYIDTIEKLIINNNPLIKIGFADNLEELDASYTKLKTMAEYPKIKKIIVYQSRLNRIPVTRHIQELHVDFRVYRNLYDTMHRSFATINFQINQSKLDECIKKLPLLDEQKDLVRSIIMSLHFDKHQKEIENLVKMIIDADQQESLCKLFMNIYYQIIQIHVLIKN